MIFTSLRTTGFRNLADTEVKTAGKDIFLVGENGQGKTNFLEALYFCSYASSFRGVRDAELARTGEKNFSAAVQITESGNFETQALVKFEDGKKTITLDSKKVEDRKELLSVIPCIVFCHEDMEFVAGSPERRRWFFDQCLSLYDPVYLDDLRRFRRVLKARNSVLRELAYGTGNSGGENPNAVLDALDPQFALYGLKLMEKRVTAAREFSGCFGPLYREVSGIEDIAVRYLPSWKGTDIAALESFLQEKRDADRAAGLSTSGPHRDRYLFNKGAAEFSGKASTGQRRLLALLLRVAQARRFSEMTGKNPVLLLDDVLLEMDGEKRRKFLSIMPGYDQAFFTFLPEEPFDRYQKSDTIVYHLHSGRIGAEVEMEK
jgi:DNA replication and repair protein RecF